MIGRVRVWVAKYLHLYPESDILILIRALEVATREKDLSHHCRVQQSVARQVSII